MMRIVVFRLFGVALFCSLAFLRSVNAQEADASAPAFDPVYPPNMSCGKISSPFGSMRDLDGRLRAAPHVGIDLGDLGDVVIAPADGTIGAVWQVEHDWGTDWNMLVIHSATDLNLPDGSVVYYTEFDHLQREDMPNIEVGSRLVRGEPIGVVRHPGNNARFRAEIHMEVHVVPVSQHAQTEWRNDDGIKYWWNPAAELIDPLALMSLHMAQIAGRGVDLAMYSPDTTPVDLRGFVYPLRCHKN